MKYKEVQKRFFKHAHFAAPTDDPDEGNAGGEELGKGSAGSGSSGDNDGGQEKGKALTFEDVLKDPALRKEFDSRIHKATETAIQNAQTRWKALTDDKVSEAEKLAKMTAQEKAAYLQSKKEKELADREAEITKRELMAQAKNTLADKKLPQELAAILVYNDAEACNNSITEVEKAFNTAVEAAVKEQLKGGEPLKKAQSNNLTLEKQIADAISQGLY